MNQFAISPYPIPKKLDYLAINTEDFLFYQTQFPLTTWTAPYAESGYSRLRAIMPNEIWRQGNYITLSPPQSPSQVSPSTPITIPQRITFKNNITLQYNDPVVTKNGVATILTLPLGWSATLPPTDFLTTTLVITDAQNKKVRSLTSPLPNFLLSTKELPTSPLFTTLSLSLDTLPSGMYTAMLSVQKETSSLVLNALGTVTRTVATSVPYGSITFAPFFR